MNYEKLSAKAVIELAAPPTWGASVVPVVFAAALSFSFARAFEPVLFYSLLLTSVCLQCAVNTLNDYADFVKGTDTAENSDDPTDASLVYNNIAPRHALFLGAGFIGLAFLCGLYALLTVGWELIFFGAAGAGIVVLYSFGKSPISCLPLGEAASGFAMGGVIPVTCCYAFAGALRFDALLYALPVMVSIGMIMFTNNISDIERDAASGRKTLPVLIGRGPAKKLHGIGAGLNAALALGIIAIWFQGGLFLGPLLIPLAAFPEGRILKAGLGPEVRMSSMRNILASHWRLCLLYIAMIVIDAAV